MKELSIEEKAKRYDEAIKLVNSKWHYKNRPCVVDVSEIFPELKESEDERIRKNLIELFHDTVSNDEIFSDYGLDKTEVLAWLEKQEKTQQEPTSDHWQEQDNTMAFTLMRDIEQVSFISKEGKDERISWLNSLEDRFSNQESNKGHWQDVRERAAIAAMHAFCVSPSSYTGNIPLDKMAQHVVKIADALVKELKGEQI